MPSTAALEKAEAFFLKKIHVRRDNIAEHSFVTTTMTKLSQTLAMLFIVGVWLCSTTAGLKSSGHGPLDDVFDDIDNHRPQALKIIQVLCNVPSIIEFSLTEASDGAQLAFGWFAL